MKLTYQFLKIVLLNNFCKGAVAFRHKHKQKRFLYCRAGACLPPLYNLSYLRLKTDGFLASANFQILLTKSEWRDIIKESKGDDGKSSAIYATQREGRLAVSSFGVLV